MKFFSSRFGEINIKEDSIIYFPEGIPGFEKFKKFALLKKEDNEMFFFLHSVEDPNLMFIITNPYLILFNYEFKIPDEDCELLELKKENLINLGVFAITKIDKEKNIFINLKAPLCINFEKNLGKQIILYDKKYSHQFKLEPEKIVENFKNTPKDFNEKMPKLNIDYKFAASI